MNRGYSNVSPIFNKQKERMETVLEEKKKTPGNPNFVKKTDSPMQIDHDKNYEFELISTYELYKPVDNESNRKVDNVYPPYVMIPNKGRAYDEERKTQRSWRYISTENSIWIDEQHSYSVEEEAEILSKNENYLEFVNGKISVRGRQENKVRALLVQDICANKKVKLGDAPPMYKLNNPDEMLAKSLASLDVEYKAMKSAQEAEEEDMMAYAYVLGINVDNDKKTIRRDFLMSAKANPTSFLKNFTASKNRYAFLFYKAFQKNIISSTYGKDKLTWFDTHELICDVKSDFNVVDELCSRALKEDKVVLKLYEQLKRMDL